VDFVNARPTKKLGRSGWPGLQTTEFVAPRCHDRSIGASAAQRVNTTRYRGSLFLLSATYVAFDLGCWAPKSKWHRDGWLATSARMLHGKYQLGVKVVKTKRRVRAILTRHFATKTDSDLGTTGILYTPKFFDVF